MSYNAINPYQTFRDSTGNVRAGGTVTFFVNTTTTLASIFSDESLLVAQNNPYTLDASGRIAGDVRYSGLMTVQEANADGSDVVTTDNVGTTGDNRADLANETDPTKGASLVGVNRNITNFPGRTLAAWISSKPKSASDAGAVGDGITNDMPALQFLSASIEDGDTIDLGNGTYLLSITGAPSDYRGHRVFDLIGKKNITFIGDGATFKVTNHDVSTNGGLIVFFGASTRYVKFKGIDFDMSFTGVYTGSTQYPFGAAIIGVDLSNADAGGARTQGTLNNNWKIIDCNFKLFHPYGQYAQSGSSYAGDPNNGFKIFPVFVSGPFDATTYASQCRNISIVNCTLEEGHNGYGFWAWAWNNVKFKENTADSFVGKQSNSLGVYSGVGVPFIRYHQFRCSGFQVLNNYFRAKPCSERTVAGFEGDSRFVDYNTNIQGNYSNGSCVIKGNTIIAGRGDAANTANDNYIQLFAYGSISIVGNTFESTTDTTNAQGSEGIFWDSEPVGDEGKATLVISGNSWSADCDYMNSITVSNGAATDATRRLKQLVISGNTSLAQSQYFLKMSATSVAFGVADLSISDNVISGEFNLKFPKTDTNSRAIELASSNANDTIRIKDNTVRDKYYFIHANTVAGTVLRKDNLLKGITTETLGSLNNSEASGSNSIASGATSRVITHTMGYAPPLESISIAFGEQATSDYGRWWISAITTTQFTLNVSVDPGVSALDFGWQIKTIAA